MADSVGNDLDMKSCVSVGMRLDKWLWQARFHKSRSLATKFCAKGRIHINGERVYKAHRLIRIGDILTFAHGDHIRILRIEQFSDRRLSPSAAKELYYDLKPTA